MTSPTPRVSIGMPVYNGAEWVGAAIECALGQSLGDLELVIADNASTDDTEAICRGYAQRDQRLRYHRNPQNIGVANNFNRVFELARAPFFKWMSCSDLIDTRYVETCLTAYDGRPDLVLVYTNVRLFNETNRDGVQYSDAFDLDLPDPVDRFIKYISEVRLNNIMHGLFRRAVLERTRLYRNFLAADYNMIANVLLHGPVLQLAPVLHARRMQEETFSGNFSAEALSRYYKPEGSGELRGQHWLRQIDFYRMSCVTPLSLRQRLRLWGFLARRVAWSRQILSAEIGQAARGLAQR